MAEIYSDEVLYDFTPMLKAYKNGRVERLTGEQFVPASIDPATRVKSKDVQISPELGVAARIYIPGDANPDTKLKLPVVVYFHGGGFAVESPFSPLYHKHLNYLVAESNAIAVSVDYRLAPEYPLPTAYDDSWLALKWVFSDEAQNEEWIKDYADLGRVYLGGDSAGGNIAHHLAIRVGSEQGTNISLRGIFLNCPFFGGKDPVGVESSEEMVLWKKFVDNLWVFVHPKEFPGYDDPWINPAKDPRVSGLGCSRVLVYVAEKDYLKDRGWYYKETLEKSGWFGEIEVVEVKGEVHVFSVFSPDGENGLAMIKKVASFINH
ncbi:hypothetical protein ABFS82_02G032100 [Erythranthe guttata]|nr:PREDICTED: probable carboxylesterase 2 [Erythranthe guttata]|eukprot:XP_012836965.1 PREDICTED: probable carboxylesterase 2 [Erythranthe guttata]